MTLTDTERNQLEGFLKAEVYGEVEVEKSYNFRKLQRNNLFWQGFHYQFPQRQSDGSIRFNTTPNGNNSDARRQYDYVLNYYRGDGKKLVGILGRSPNAIVSADDQEDEAQVSRAATANTLLTNIRWHWDVEMLNSELVFGLWTNGPMYGYTPFVSDKRYGVTKIPIMKMSKVVVEPAGYLCWNCGASNNSARPCFECGTELTAADYRPAETADMPIPDGEDQYANGSVEFFLYSGYEVIVPSRIKSLEDAPWLVLEMEQHFGALMLAYPESKALLNRIQGGGTGGSLTSLGETTRSLASDPSTMYTTKQKNMWTHTRIWLTPAEYEVMEVKGNKELADRFRREYPDGVKVCSLNGVVVREEPEGLHECWFECKPEVGQYLDTQALGDDYIRVNRLIDDTFNIQVETAEKGLPLTFYDPTMLDPNALNKHQSNPVDFLPVLPGMGTKIREALHTTQGIEMTQAPMAMAAAALAAVRENSGVTAPLFGGDSGTQTLGEAEMKRNMALMPHNVTWNFIRRFWAGCYANGIRQLAKYGYERAYFGGKRNEPVRKVDMPELSSLLEGGWHVECEEAVPMTWGQRRAQINQFLDRGPEFWQMLGLTNPNNLSSLLKTMGNEDIQIPGLKEREKAMRTISELLQGAPQESMGMDGQMELLSSIPADEFEDNHDFMVQVVREWAATKPANLARQTNPGGYANVIAWGREHQKMAMPPPMPEENGPGGGPPPQGGGSPPSSPEAPPESMEKDGLALEQA